ncbi:hypothetical protein [Gryllotalpicola sp.]|uniref:hypothetical protein n=1 Tax=Gryllotalpicola sp. TaxID=1932787 RepID=UPI0026375525|nr:hypothetical protein [Gryllotalpicola sp.]
MVIIKLIVAGVFFLGGWALFGVAHYVPGSEAVTYFAGIVAEALAFALPIHLFSRS